DPRSAVEAGTALADLIVQPGFAVYRNTVQKGCIDALQANYPAVARLVGDEWMRAAAAVFMRAHLPATPVLLDYGAEFPAFLEAFEPAAQLPYLGKVARLDRFWTEAHCARDEAPVHAAAITGLSAAQLARTRLRPHASARWIWFEQQPVFTIWSRNRGADSCDDEIVWQGEGALIVRPDDTVEPLSLDAAGVVFLDCCAAGKPLADAALAVLLKDPDANLAQLTARLLGAGAFGQIETAHEADPLTQG